MRRRSVCWSGSGSVLKQSGSVRRWSEAERAEAERLRAEQLAQKLRELGVEFDE
jgi:hypothetical protein